MKKPSLFRFFFLLLIFSSAILTAQEKNIVNVLQNRLSGTSSVINWKPSFGSPSYFISETVKKWIERKIDTSNQNQKKHPFDNADHLLILLGKNSENLWTVEGGAAHDASVNFYLDLVKTSSNGKREKFSIIASTEIEEKPEIIKNKMPNSLSTQAKTKLLSLSKERKFPSSFLVPVDQEIIQQPSSEDHRCVALFKDQSLKKEFCWYINLSGQHAWDYHWTCEVKNLPSQK